MNDTLQTPQKPHHKLLLKIIELIRNPTGDKFDLIDTEEKQEEFITTWNSIYKNLHYFLIEGILAM